MVEAAARGAAVAPAVRVVASAVEVAAAAAPAVGTVNNGGGGRAFALALALLLALSAAAAAATVPADVRGRITGRLLEGDAVLEHVLEPRLEGVGEEPGAPHGGANVVGRLGPDLLEDLAGMGAVVRPEAQRLP